MPAAGTLPTARVAPPRRFENYILTRVVDSSAGLTEFKDSDFTQLSGPADYTGYNIGQGGCDDAYSNVYNIGFDFSLDGITYKQFVANVNGWMVLVDPTLGSFNPNEVITGSPWQNPTIKSTFSSNAVLLAPWFDDLFTLMDVPSKLVNSPTSYSSIHANRIAQGLEPKPPGLDSVAYAVSYKHDHRSTRGRRLIIRWNCFSNYSQPTTVLKFEVVIYENGTIEYRYVPKSGLGNAGGSAFEGATIGIFMPNGSNRFRDFAIGLGYRDDARQEYIYGGYVYTPFYSDVAQPGNEDAGLSAPFTINLRPDQYWPGLLTGGSIFRFEPPLARRKVLPRLAVRKQDSKLQLPTVARTGDDRLGNDNVHFDDRRSAIYGVRPTFLPPAIPTAGNLNGLEWLIPATGNFNSNVYDCSSTPVVVTTTMAGDSNTVFNVQLRFRGVIEHKSYSGGTFPDSFNNLWVKGGTPSGTAWNVYKLTISSPYQVYYLNNGADSDFHIYSI